MLSSGVMPEQHRHSVVVSCLHFRVVFPVTNVSPATLSILLEYVSLPFSGNSCHLPRWAGGANAGAWVQLLWGHLALAGCAGRGWVPSQTHLILWRLCGASWGQRKGFRCTSLHHYTWSWQQPCSYLCSLQQKACLIYIGSYCLPGVHVCKICMLELRLKEPQCLSISLHPQLPHKSRQ